ncbi:transposase, IS4 family, partial [Aggregatibacter actinomycetemcomitans Y4]
MTEQVVFTINPNIAIPSKVFCTVFAQDVLGVIYLQNLVCGTPFIAVSIYGQRKVFGKKCLRFFRQCIDSEWIFIDGSIVKAHQHAMGASGQNPQAIGKSVAGNTTKIHLAVDSCGNPIDFILTGGEVHDSKAAPDLVALLPDSEAIIADRGYDCQALRELILTDKKAIPVLPRKRNSKVGNDDVDWCLYRYRHLVENAFALLNNIEPLRLNTINWQGIMLPPWHLL